MPVRGAAHKAVIWDALAADYNPDEAARKIGAANAHLDPPPTMSEVTTGKMNAVPNVSAAMLDCSPQSGTLGVERNMAHAMTPFSRRFTTIGPIP